MRRRRHRRPRGRLPRLVRGESGQATIELIGYMPYIVLMFLVFVEAFAFFMTMEEVDSAARAGARVAAQGGNGSLAAREALPDRLQKSTTKINVNAYQGDAHATVTARVPVVFKLDIINWTVTRSATIPVG